jgi:hypothetical protein
MVEHEITLASANPYLPIFILQELQQSPERLMSYAHNAGVSPHVVLKRASVLIAEAVKKGKIRDIEPRQLLVNIMSLCMYPVVAKPILKSVLELDESGFQTLMSQRIQHVSEFIMLSLKPGSR